MFEYLINVLLALAVVVLVILIGLPFVLKRYIPTYRRDGTVKVKSVFPIARNVFVVELSIENSTIVVIVGEGFAQVIYRKDGDAQL